MADSTDYDSQVAIALLTEGLKQPQLFHEKPSKVIDPGFDIAAANRVNTGARLRGSNTVATIDNNGRAVITGGRGITTGYETGVEGQAPAGFTSSSRPSGGGGTIQQSFPTSTSVQPRQLDTVLSSDHYLGEMRRIDSIQDPNEKFFAVSQLRGSVEETLAKFKAGASTQADLEFKVPELLKTLQQNEQEDRSDPNYQKYQADSKITQSVRQQYESALQASRARGDTIFQSNPEAAKLAGMITPFLEYTMANLAKQDLKADERAAKAEALSAQFGTGHIDLAKVIAPGADPVQTAAREYKNIPFREAAMAMNTPEDLVPMALAGNTYAKAGVIHKQAALLADTEDTNSSAYQNSFLKAQKDYRAMESLIKNGVQFDEKVKQLFPNSTKREELLSDYNLLGADTSKTKARENFRATLAPRLLSIAKEDSFLSNVAGWQGSELLASPSTEISKVYTETQQRLGAGATISLDALASGIKKLPKKVRAKARDELVAIATQAKNKEASGLYGTFGDDLDLETKINTIISQRTLDEALADNPDTLGIYGGGPALSLYRLLNSAGGNQ